MKAQRLGILSGLVASVCCLGPPLLILLGLGSLGVGAFLGKYHWHFILGGGVLLTMAWSRYFKEKQQCQTHQCQMVRQGTTRGILIAATLIVAVFLGLNAYTYLAPQINLEKKTTMNSPTFAQTVIPVAGMSCFTCELSVEKSLKNLQGVKSVKASAKDKRATIQYDPSLVTIQQMVQAINRTGYKALNPKE